jgi:signal transduction histidine kinase
VTISEGHVAFHVRDTGIGLSREDREVIFEKFRRGDQGIQVEPNGTGLGLYIVKRIIEILGGTIDVESAGRGKGSEFILTIPVEIAPSN